MKESYFRTSMTLYLTLMLLFLGIRCYADGGDNNHMIDNALDFFEFVKCDQKNAFKTICKHAGININEKFNGTEALILVDLIQKQLVNRNTKQERWEIDALNWMNENREETITNLKILGFLESILPKESEYDCVCALGAGMPVMRERIKFLETLVAGGLKTQRIILLTGERYAKENVDGTKEELLKIANTLSIDVKDLTETHLFKYLYNNSSLANKFELIIIDTPQRDGFRPTTKTTLDDFCKWHTTHPEIKNSLFISSQPYVKYQKITISEVLLNNKSNLKIEVVGNACTYGDIKYLVGALGSYIWAAMPSCLRHLNIDIKSSLPMAKKLYGHQPWLYKCLPMGT